MSDCILCAIVSKDAEASVVYEDDTVLAFMDLQPATTGHLLVVPREHIVYLGEVPAELAAHLFTVRRPSPLRCLGQDFRVKASTCSSQRPGGFPGGVPHASTRVSSDEG
jgi:hypothetical protein